MTRTGGLLSAALRNRAGGVMILTAITMPLLITVVGFAADYGYATYVNQRLARAADTATLSSVSQSAATAVGGYANTTWLQIYGQSIFNENLKQMKITGANANLSVVSDGNGGVIATGTYNYAMPTFFSGIIGIKTMPLTGTIVSTAKPPTYVNYYILVDGSQSMGIATSQADMVTLFNRVKAYGNGTAGETGCVFGCHVKGPGQKYTNEYLAHGINPPVTLRIDSAVQAIQQIVATAQSTVGTAKNIAFGLYVMQADPTTGKYLNTIVSPPSTDYTTVSSSAATIDLGNNVPGGTGDTDYVDELADFNANVLPTNGSGASAASPLNYVFIITDGVSDTPTGGNCTWGHCIAPLDPSRCDALKAKATVGVIYTTYAPIMNDPNNPTTPEFQYKTLVGPIANQIQPNLQACATSASYFFQATYGSDIVSAMQTLFNKTLPISARLQQ